MPRLNLDPRTPSVIVPLFAQTMPELAAQAAAAAAAPEADIVELRLDPLPQEDWFAAALAVSAAMPQKHNIADFLCSINVHIDSSRTLICRRPYLGEHTRLLSAWRSARSCIQESPSRSDGQTALPSIYL